MENGGRVVLRLGELQVQGVDLLGADIAREKWGVAGAEAGPGAGTKLAGVSADVFQADDSIELGIADAETIVGGIGRVQSVKVQVSAIRRPGYIADQSLRGEELPPLPGLCVEEQQFAGVVRKSNDKAAIRRPTGTKDSLRTSE